MSTEEHKAIVRRLFEELYRKRKMAVLKEVIAPDYVLRTVADTGGWRSSKRRGPECYEGFMKVWWEAFPDFSGTIDQMVAEGDKVATVCTFSGTHRGGFPWGPFGTVAPTGRHFDLPDLVVSHIVDGMIVEEWESVDHGSLWRQLGVIPPRA